MKTTEQINQLFGGVEVKFGKNATNPDLQTVAKAVLVVNMLKSVSVPIHSIVIRKPTGGDSHNIWIKFPNKMELGVRSNEDNRNHDYTNRISFGSQNGCKKKATQLAADILKVEMNYSIEEPKTDGKKETKGIVIFDYTNSTKSMRKLLDLVTALELAEDATN
jgi:hypothetical protein